MVHSGGTRIQWRQREGKKVEETAKIMGRFAEFDDDQDDDDDEEEGRR